MLYRRFDRVMAPPGRHRASRSDGGWSWPAGACGLRWDTCSRGSRSAERPASRHRRRVDGRRGRTRREQPDRRRSGRLLGSTSRVAGDGRGHLGAVRADVCREPGRPSGAGRADRAARELGIPDDRAARRPRVDQLSAVVGSMVRLGVVAPLATAARRSSGRSTGRDAPIRGVRRRARCAGRRARRARDGRVAADPVHLLVHAGQAIRRIDDADRLCRIHRIHVDRIRAGLREPPQSHRLGRRDGDRCRSGVGTAAPPRQADAAHGPSLRGRPARPRSSRSGCRRDRLPLDRAHDDAEIVEIVVGDKRRHVPAVRVVRLVRQRVAPLDGEHHAFAARNRQREAAHVVGDERS